MRTVSHTRAADPCEASERSRAASQRKSGLCLKEKKVIAALKPRGIAVSSTSVGGAKDDDGRSACGTYSQFLFILSPLLTLVIHLLHYRPSFLHAGKRLRSFIAARLRVDPAEDAEGSKEKKPQRASTIPVQGSLSAIMTCVLYSQSHLHDINLLNLVEQLIFVAAVLLHLNPALKLGSF